MNTVSKFYLRAFHLAIVRYLEILITNQQYELLLPI